MTNIGLMRRNKRELEYVLENPKHSLCFKVRGSWSVCGESVVADCFNWNPPENIEAIVMNDKYVHIRKAIAEGREIEVQDTADTWSPMCQATSKSSIFWYPSNRYRVKARFKVGDYVRYLGNPSVITQSDRLGYIMYKGCCAGDNNESLKEWKPREGELVLVAFSSRALTLTRYETKHIAYKCIPYLGYKGVFNE